MVKKVVRRISRPYVGYLFLLLGFTFLGLFVAALAFGSHLTAAAGVAMAGAFVGSVASFRPWAPQRGANTLTRAELEQYRANFGGDRREARRGGVAAAAPSALRPSRRQAPVAAVPTKLSA